MKLGALTSTAALAVLLASTVGCFGLDVLSPPESCDLEVTVDDRDFDVECDYDDDEHEYECTCEGNQIPAAQEPPSCAEQCEGEPTCAEQCAGSEDPDCAFDCEECVDICEEGDEGRDDGDGPVFSEDFEDDSFCSRSDDEQEQAAIDACDLD